MEPARTHIRSQVGEQRAFACGSPCVGERASEREGPGHELLLAMRSRLSFYILLTPRLLAHRATRPTGDWRLVKNTLISIYRDRTDRTDQAPCPLLSSRLPASSSSSRRVQLVGRPQKWRLFRFVRKRRKRSKIDFMTMTTATTSTKDPSCSKRSDHARSERIDFEMSVQNATSCSLNAGGVEQ